MQQDNDEISYLHHIPLRHSRCPSLHSAMQSKQQCAKQGRRAQQATVPFLTPAAERIAITPRQF